MTIALDRLDPLRSAVLSMDLQTGIASVYLKDQPELLPRAAGVLNRARTAGCTVIHIRVGFRAKLPEVSARNALFNAIRTSAQHQQLFEGANGEVHPLLGPEGDDIVVTKHRLSAFAGTDLRMILHAKEIDTLVLFGVATSGVVLSTLLDASDEDYRLGVIKDCCADSDPEVHATLIERFFPRRAAVMSASEFEKTLVP